jgi:UDP-N-acetylmuramoylalanine-D-glutamate ligase
MGKVLIYGMGKTGKAVVDFLSKQGIENYIMVDEEEGIYNKDVIISPDRINKFKKDVELVVKSPGIPISEVKKYIDNVEIISEIEFAYRALEKKGVSPKL